MRQIHTLIIGAGQAGLAMSRCLSDRAIPHVLLDRGEIGNAWRHARWDSLTLLTPNWQSRLPGFAYSGPNPDGFMSMDGIVGHLETYARISRAPVETRTSVLGVSAEGQGYRVETDHGDWLCRNLVMATGARGATFVPGFAAALPDHITQITPLDYKNPAQVQQGGVLVVGASASGVQLAAEIADAGHDVVLSAGHHIRVPRFYRGRDIQWWMDVSGINDMSIRDVDDPVRARRVPSLQLTGTQSRRLTDLNTLQQKGVEITGRLAAIRDGKALFSGSLANAAALSDLKMDRLLAGFDAWAEETGTRTLLPPERFEPTRLPEAPRLALDLMDGRIRTIVWATGYRPDFSYLNLPVFDRKGQLMHADGRVAPGLCVLGLPFMRRRKSALINGVGGDASAHADHIMRTGSLRVA